MFRRLLILTLLLAAVFSSSALAANVKVRVEGRTQTIYGTSQPSLQADNALQALDLASVAGEFHYALTPSSFGDYVSQIGKYAAAGIGRLGLQGERRLAAGRRRQGRAEGRRRRALVLGDVRRRGRAADARPAPASAATATSSSRSTTPASARGRPGRRSTRTASASPSRSGRACIGRHTGSRARDRPGSGSLELGAMTCGASARCFVLCLLAGCGGAGEESGTATLWVTRDRGAELLLDAEVPAGQTLMRALASKLDIETRYGGRFLQAVDGLEGSLDSSRDWFWFVNGYEGDRSAAEYRLRDGDVAWWDYRAWEREGEARVVVGAFPEPFLHGFGGRVRPAAVRYAPGERGRAEELAERGRRRARSSRSGRRSPPARTCSRCGRGRRACAPSCWARRPATRSASSSRGRPATPTRRLGCREARDQPGSRRGSSRCGRLRRAPRRPDRHGGGDRASSSCSSACGRRRSGAASTSSARSSPASACSSSRRSSGRARRESCCGRGRRCPCSGRST